MSTLSLHTDAPARETLPDSRPRNRTGGLYRDGQWWTPVYCANCGHECGLVPEDTTTGCFFLCDKRCADTWSLVAGQMVLPDALWHDRVTNEMLERYGRLLGPLELIAALSDVNHPLTRLVRDRADLTPKAG